MKWQLWRPHFSRPSRTQVLSYVLFAFSACVLVGVFLFTMSVDVLKDWQLILPEGDFKAGQTIVLQSQYTKLRPVKGKATRYIDCKNNNNLFIRYPLNEAVADRAPGKGGTGVVIKLPTDIPSLPTTCHISINVDYKVYPWRTVTEFASSRDFTLLPPDPDTITVTKVVVVQDAPQLATQSSPLQVALPSPVIALSVSSPTDNAPPASTTQPETSQAEMAQASAPQQPQPATPLEVIINKVREIL